MCCSALEVKNSSIRGVILASGGTECLPSVPLSIAFLCLSNS